MSGVWFNLSSMYKLEINSTKRDNSETPELIQNFEFLYLA